MSEFDEDDLLERRAVARQQGRDALAAGEHSFVAVVGYELGSADLDELDRTGHLEFDTDALMSMSAMCLVCEQAYSPQLRAQSCPGDPSGLVR